MSGAKKGVEGGERGQKRERAMESGGSQFHSQLKREGGGQIDILTCVCVCVCLA